MAAGRTSAAIELLCDALSLHYADRRSFPKTQDDFEQALTGAAEPLLRKSVLIDEWGRPIKYSLGEDGATILSDAVLVGNSSDDISCSLRADLDHSLIRSSRNLFGDTGETESAKLIGE